MTFGPLGRKYQSLLFFACIGFFPLLANNGVHDDIGEKQVKLAMRMIGHEVLLGLGDCESRVMPIEKIDDRYKISFESQLGFDPGDIASIITRVMSESKIAAHYLVELEQCNTKEVVHGFEIRNPAAPNMIACRGRILPEDCYSLFVTIIKDFHFENLAGATLASDILPPQDPFPTIQETKESSLFQSIFLIIPALILVGFIFYSMKKKGIAEADPNVISIGGSRFDTRNMSLSFEDNKVELSYKEAALLALLHHSENKPIEREVILQKVWSDEGGYVGRTLDVFISKLRKKLEPDDSVKIVNIRGLGYKLVVDVT